MERDDSSNGKGYGLESSFHINRCPFQNNSSWHHFLKVEMNIFDGIDPLGWVTQMEHYFSLHGITHDLMKLKVGALYLDSKCW